MKKIIIKFGIPFLIVGVWLVVSMIVVKCNRKRVTTSIDLQSQETINKIQHERDSLLKANELQADSLQASTLRIHTLEFEKNQLHRQAILTITEHEKMHFVTLNDTSRVWNLSDLYHSYPLSR